MRLLGGREGLAERMALGVGRLPPVLSGRLFLLLGWGAAWGATGAGSAVADAAPACAAVAAIGEDAMADGAPSDGVTGGTWAATGAAAGVTPVAGGTGFAEDAGFGAVLSGLFVVARPAERPFAIPVAPRVIGSPQTQHSVSVCVTVAPHDGHFTRAFFWLIVDLSPVVAMLTRWPGRTSVSRRLARLQT